MDNKRQKEDPTKLIADYITEMEIRISALQENIVFANKLMETFNSVIKPSERGDYLWRVETESKGEETIKSILCLGRGETIGDVIFENNWFQKGDTCANERIRITLTSGPSPTRTFHNSKQTYSYGYVVVSEDPTLLPVSGEYYGKLLLS